MVRNEPQRPARKKASWMKKQMDIQHELKDIIRGLKDRIKKLEAENRSISKALQEYDDYWDSISDEFYKNKALVAEYEKKGRVLQISNEIKLDEKLRGITDKYRYGVPKDSLEEFTANDHELGRWIDAAVGQPKKGRKNR